MYLSPWQRIKRRVSLLGGSYTHPDGHIELDFEAPAGIDSRNDSEEVQEAKLLAYERKRGLNKLKATYLIIPMHSAGLDAITLSWAAW